MVFCTECGAKVLGEAKFCKDCGAKIPMEKNRIEDENEIKVVERVVEKHYQEKPKGGGGGFLLLLIIIGLIVVGFFIAAGRINIAGAAGSGVPYVDPCERELNQCNHACGEGILSSVCKEKCTYDYNQCRKG